MSHLFVDSRSSGTLAVQFQAIFPETCGHPHQDQFFFVLLRQLVPWKTFHFFFGAVLFRETMVEIRQGSPVGAGSTTGFTEFFFVFFLFVEEWLYLGLGIGSCGRDLGLFLRAQRVGQLRLAFDVLKVGLDLGGAQTLAGTQLQRTTTKKKCRFFFQRKKQRFFSSKSVKLGKAR